MATSVTTTGSNYEEKPFLLQLAVAKSELNEKIMAAEESVAERLKERVLQLQSEFKRIEDEYNSKEVTDEIAKLEAEKGEIRFKDCEKGFMRSELERINLRINELETMMEKSRAKFRRVEFEWDELPLENILCKVGSIRVSAVPNYKQLSYPVMFAGTHSYNSPNSQEFRCPRSLAINPETNNIYICGTANNRVQVYNESLEFIRDISDKMKGPAYICMQLNKLKSLISDVRHPKDVRLTSQEVVVLMEGEKCIRFYNYSHQLIRDIITYGEDNQVGLLSHFCIYSDSNILITDHSDSCHFVLIFSSSEKLIHKIGECGEDRGQLNSQKINCYDRNEYRDYFYESLEFITGRKKDVIIRDVKWYFILNFFRMSSFYQI
ncbi:RING finger protein nhl-1 [Oopsacas minuta]|uniref:RING finger protein nhl-1 n=1 Tax=Oopsacas minuta TaxID=111878 RepID=A0AAV7KGU1_9METZ|nr:RING finger protein nhl-1 [Oopsacas minuta]